MSDPKKEEESRGCCGCGSESNPIPEHLRDGDVFSDRSCTDCCMIPFYFIFLVGWIVVISVAAANGKPVRILLPDNFEGQLCGDGDLVALNSYFAPLPSRPKYGFCTEKCPRVGDVVCNNMLQPKIAKKGEEASEVRNDFYNMKKDAFIAGAKAAAKCKVSCSDAEQLSADSYLATRIKMEQKHCFLVFYPSKASLQRCIPTLNTDDAGGDTANLTLMSTLNETASGLSVLGDTLGASSFFTLGFAEVKQTWLVILVAAITCMGVAFIWVILLRWILAPIVYLVLILILGILIALGFIFKWLADDLESTSLPGESGTDNQITLWRACQWISFFLAVIYVVVMLWLIKRIRIALAIMEEAANAFIASPSMVVVPVITFFLLIGWVAFFVVSTIYIQTMGEFTTDKIKTTSQNYAGDNVNVSALLESNAASKLANITIGDTAPVLNRSTYTVEDTTKILHAYNIFMILWTGNFCMMFGYMVLVFIVTSWYFSATQEQMRRAENGEGEEAPTPQPRPNGDGDAGDVPKPDEKPLAKEKGTNCGVMCSAFRATFCNHMGTVLWGSLLIAIIQFVRAVFLYIQETYLKDWKESATGRVALYCINCCLSYIEKIVKIISKNAFIVSVIKCQGFCSSAIDAVKILFDNVAAFAVLGALSTATLFLVKVFIVGSNMCIAFGLLKVRSLTEDKAVESGLFPMFLIFLMSFAIAALFMDVYEASIDTIFICFVIDRDEFKSEFMPESLADIIDTFKHVSESQAQADTEMAKAMSHAAEVKEKKK